MVPRLLLVGLLALAPVLGTDVEYATLIGGYGDDIPFSVGVDNTGRAYFLGSTDSPNLLTTSGAVQPACGSDGICDGGEKDLFLGRLNPEGSEFEVLTYLGGRLSETPKAIRVDPQGNLFVAGRTESPDFALGDSLFGSADGRPTDFITKLTPSGSRIAYSIALPGFNLADIALDSLGNIWLVGTGVRPLPTTDNAAQKTPRSSTSLYVAAVDPSGRALLFATYWGGRSGEIVGSIAVGPDDSMTVCGVTRSADFPVTPGALKPAETAADMFAARFRLDGQTVFSTPVGGSDAEYLEKCLVDASGSVHFMGSTGSPNFPWTHGPPAPAGPHWFYLRVAPDGSAVEQARYLSAPIRGASVVTPAGKLIWIGADPSFIGDESLRSLDADGNPSEPVILSHYASEPAGGALALDANENLYVFGSVFEQELRRTGTGATPNAAQRSWGGGVDARLTKLSSRLPTLRVSPESAVIQSTNGRSEDLKLVLWLDGEASVLVPLQMRAENSWLTLQGYGGGGPLVGPATLGTLPHETTVTITPPSDQLGVYETAVVFEAPGRIAAPVRVPIRFEITDTNNRSARQAIRAHYRLGDPEPPVAIPSLVPDFHPDVVPRFETSEPWVSVVKGSYSNTWDAIIDPSGLGPGVHQAEIIVRGPAPAPEFVVPVILYVEEPYSRTGPSSLYLSGVAGGSEPVEAQILLRVTHPNATTFPLAALKTDQPWLEAAAMEASVPGRIELRAHPEDLAPGRYTATVTATPAAPMPPWEVGVLFDVAARPTLSANPAAISYLVPSAEMLVGQRTIHLDSAVPQAFRVENGNGLGIHVEPAEGVTPADLAVSMDAGVYDTGGESEIIVVTETSRLRIPVTLSKQPLSPTLYSLVNAASYREGYVAPGSLATIFGDQLSYVEWIADELPIQPFPYQTGVTIDRHTSGSGLAPILYNSPSQINIQIPNLPPGPASVLVGVGGGGGSESVPFEIRESAPGIFAYADNRAVVQHQDGSLNTADNGGAPGGVGVLYLTGQGPTEYVIQEGRPTPSRVLVRATLPVELRIGGVDAEVLFAGLTPGFVGLCQVNFYYPDLPPGEYPITVQFGNELSNEAKVTIR